MSKAAKKYKAAELVDLIRTKYSGEAFTVLEQVADGTGRNATSWIDAAVFSLWPSNGLWRAACEVKVSRSDFLNELANPLKNEWAREHFDYFWYVVAPGVAKDDEIPTGCGLMVVRGNGLGVVKQAPRREGVKTDQHVIASFARSLDKERQRFMRDGLREAIEADSTYREAQCWMEGGKKYLSHHREWFRPKTSAEVFDKLMAVAREKSPVADDIDHALEVLSRLQGNVLDFVVSLAPLAVQLLNARDEAGQHLVARYGGLDKGSIEALQAVVKARGERGYRHGKDQAKRHLAAREALSAIGGQQ